MVVIQDDSQISGECGKVVVPGSCLHQACQDGFSPSFSLTRFQG